MVEVAPIEKIKVILGLGNPGHRYADTRHNFGYMLIDRLAFLKKEKFSRGDGPFVYCRIVLADSTVYLCKSTTYMNNTGKAAAAIRQYFRLVPQNFLVVSDDCNLPLGKMRYRGSGSDGGHNGLASVIGTLQSQEFPRLRLGIEANPHGKPLEDYVLEDFSREEFEIVDKVIESGIGFIEKLMTGDVDNKSLTITII